jgi:hypothetical protein|nr:MAG TPA: hypothetical protein [Caudoviricetes sp.]
MQRIKASGVVSVMPPVQENSYNPGYFSNGNPATGELATMMTAEWCNGVQEELINVISKSGLTPDQTELDQLWQAIQKLFSTSDAEKWRKSMIGSLVPMTASTLPEGFGLPDGSLFLFEDYPELKEKYDAGGFNGMTLEANASAEDKAAWVGKWVKHPQGLGLYAPRLSGLFLRNAETVGAYNAPGIPDFTGGMGDIHVGAVPSASGACRWHKTGACQELSINTGIWNYGNFSVTGSLSHPVYGASSSVMPASADVSMGLYLGRPA